MYTLEIFQILRYLVTFIFIRVHSPLFFCHFSTAVFSYEMFRSRSLLLKSFHIRRPDPSHFVTSQLRPFHAECPDPGHGTRNYLRSSKLLGAPTYYLLFRMYSGFGSTSCLLLGLCRQVRIFIWRCF